MKQVLDPAAQWGCDICGRVELGRHSSAVFQFSIKCGLKCLVFFSVVHGALSRSGTVTQVITEFIPVTSASNLLGSSFHCLCVKFALFM